MFNIDGAASVALESVLKFTKTNANPRGRVSIGRRVDVGNPYAMLEEVHALRANGVQVLLIRGTDGRTHTEALVRGFDINARQRSLQECRTRKDGIATKLSGHKTDVDMFVVRREGDLDKNVASR
jgi:K+-sensing histidine kinase KdpD